MSLDKSGKSAGYLAIDPARFIEPADWIIDAPCAGAWDLFDVPVLRDLHAAFQYAAPALELCAACPFTEKCIARVDPFNSLFDGVCGGLLWRNGRATERPAAPKPEPKPRDRSGDAARQAKRRADKTDDGSKRAFDNALIRAAGRPAEVDVLTLWDAALTRCACGSWMFSGGECGTCRVVAEAVAS
jgi:WhiB family redox-sensing transcriptional regulator